ncbi:MAG: hypothetical protein KGL39_47845 [Patescibacteria group bacterium]|nr:hypothetical protein [Patescibacteria group bacterium]
MRAVKLTAKGARIFSFDLEWLNGVIDHAAKHDEFDMGAVVFRPKGSPKLYAVIDADDLLELLKRTPGTSRKVS